VTRIPLVGAGFLVILISGALASALAYAGKPSWAGGGKGAQHAVGAKGGWNAGVEKSSHGYSHTNAHGHFDENARVAVHEYFANEFRHGDCPPGLARKRNGCMPPGLAKQWQIGHSLPRDVAVYDLPPELVVKIGLPPSGHKYVRVASDILLIAVGTGMVVDAIDDLRRM